MSVTPLVSWGLVEGEEQDPLGTNTVKYELLFNLDVQLLEIWKLGIRENWKSKIFLNGATPLYLVVWIKCI